MSNIENTTTNITTPKQRLLEQKKSLIIGIVILAGLFGLFILSDAGKPKTVKPSKDKKKEEYTITIADITKNAKTEDRWLVNAQEKIEKQEYKIDETAQGNQRLKSEIEELKSERLLQEEKFSALEAKIELLSNKITTEGIHTNIQSNSGELNPNAGAMPVPQQPSITTINFDDNGSDDFKSSSQVKQTTFNTKEGYIPQGSYVSAKIISAVDVQVGVSAQSNPKPVLLRITGDAKSAIFQDKKLSVDITGCLITAGAIGELSSEKVYIKLSKMTCAKNNDEVTEVPVQGYISAKGSNGIRGQVIMKEGSMIGKSFLAGMVGGLGQAYSQSLAPPLTFGGGTTTQTAISAENAAKRGIGGGLGTSGNQISQYLIKRAEQYQPVISIPSGIEVEVVFLDGFFLDGRNKEVKAKTKEVAKENTKEIEENNNNTNEEE
jgi:conjugal transfer pilus assembly protein TraB